MNSLAGGTLLLPLHRPSKPQNVSPAKHFAPFAAAFPFARPSLPLRFPFGLRSLFLRSSFALCSVVPRSFLGHSSVKRRSAPFQKGDGARNERRCTGDVPGMVRREKGGGQRVEGTTRRFLFSLTGTRSPSVAQRSRGVFPNGRVVPERSAAKSRGFPQQAPGPRA